MTTRKAKDSELDQAYMMGMAHGARVLPGMNI